MLQRLTHRTNLFGCWPIASTVSLGVAENRRAAWQLGSSAYPDLCPAVCPESLLELRLFGERGELLLWRDDEAGKHGFRGRWLSDAATAAELLATTDPHRPEDEERILIGNQRLDSKARFMRIADGTGREQAVPLACGNADFGTGRKPKSPLRLSIRHYFTTDRKPARSASPPRVWSTSTTPPRKEFTHDDSLANPASRQPAEQSAESTDCPRAVQLRSAAAGDLSRSMTESRSSANVTVSRLRNE
jgi:hypothetical protein